MRARECLKQLSCTPGTVAGEVETALHSLGGGVTAKYKAKFRSLSFNLKDVNNPDLRRAVLAREIDAQVTPSHPPPSRITIQDFVHDL